MAEVREENIADFQKVILQWFTTNGRDFPWRKLGLSNYQLVIAEVLLQRTKAETVSRFYGQFIKEFPNWSALVNAEMQVIENYLVPIGLYKQRSKRLKNLSVEMEKREGEFPIDRIDLETIPFIGQYIANAIELLIFKKQTPLIDVNMSRVLERYFGKRKMADIRYDPYLQGLAYKIVAHNRAKDINWAILDFAAIVCKPKPLCTICPLNKYCNFYSHDGS